MGGIYGGERAVASGSRIAASPLAHGTSGDQHVERGAYGIRTRASKADVPEPLRRKLDELKAKNREEARDDRR